MFCIQKKLYLGVTEQLEDRHGNKSFIFPAVLKHLIMNCFSDLSMTLRHSFWFNAHKVLRCQTHQEYCIDS